MVASRRFVFNEDHIHFGFIFLSPLLNRNSETFVWDLDIAEMELVVDSTQRAIA